MNKKEYGLVLVVAVTAGLLGGMASSWFFIPTHLQGNVIEAKQFAVTAEDGKKALALLGKTGNGEIGLYLYEKSGTHVTVLSPGSVALYEMGKRTAMLRPESLGLYEGSDQETFIRRTLLHLGPNGEPSLELYDKTEKLRTALG